MSVLPLRGGILSGLTLVAALASVFSIQLAVLSAGDAPAASTPTENAVAKVLPSVVTVQSRTGQGTAFAFQSAGRLITNLHVVAGSDQVLVTTAGGATVRAAVLAVDEAHDLALLGVALDIRPLEAAPGQLKVGQDVLAVGSPLGLDGTVSKGIISSVKRRGNDGASIQTNISLNSGNSGGPLIDTDGRVVGVNTSVAAASQGIGFAVPISLASELNKEDVLVRQRESSGFPFVTVAAGAAIVLLILILLTAIIVRRRRGRVKVSIKSQSRRGRRSAKDDSELAEQISLTPTQTDEEG